MADISLIIDVQQNGVVKAVKDTKTLEGNVKLLAKAFKSGDLSQRQYYKGISQLAKATGKSETELRGFATTLRRVEAATKKAKVAADAEKRAVQEYAKARRKATEENTRFGAEQRKSAKTARDAATANRRLRMEFKEGYAAQVQLRAAQMRLSSAMRKGIIDADQYEVQLQQLKVAQQTMGAAAQVGGRRVNSSGMLIQQAGYQFGDFAVQVQGGTNPMVAFGQQATQMIGAFNMLPQATLAASVGIGALRVSVVALIASLGVIIPVLTAVGAYFMRAREAANSTTDSIETFEDRLKSARGEITNMKQALEVLRGGFESVFELTLNEEIVQARISIRDAQREINDEMRRGLEVALAQNKAYGTLTDEQVRAQAEAALASSSVLLAARERLKTAEEELAVFEATAVEIRKRERDESVVNQLHEARMIIQDQERQSAIEYQKRLTRIKGLMGTLLAESRDNAKALEDAAEAARRLYDTDLSKGVRAAAEAAQQLAKDLGISLRSAMAMAGMIVTRPQGDVFDPRDPRNQSSESALERARRIMESGELTNSTLDKPTSSASGSTGGSASTLSTAAADSLRTYKEALKEVMALEAERTALVEPMARAFTDGFTSMVDGTMKVKDAFKAMALDIVKQLWKIFVVEQLVNSITGSFGIGGGSGMTMTPKANPLSGLSGAQMLPPGYSGGGYTGNGSRSGGMDGEGGFLAMLHPRETVVDHAKGQSTGGDTINISQSFNFSANGDESVKKIIAQAAPQIAQMTQKSMMDQRRRGGAMKSTFG